MTNSGLKISIPSQSGLKLGLKFCFSIRIQIFQSGFKKRIEILNLDEIRIENFQSRLKYRIEILNLDYFFQPTMNPISKCKPYQKFYTSLKNINNSKNLTYFEIKHVKVDFELYL